MTAFFGKLGVLCSVFVVGLAAGTQAQASDAVCHYNEIGALPLELLAEGPVVQGSINGKPVRMLLETGATVTFLLKAEMDRQGLSMAHQRQRVSGASDGANMFLVRIRDITIGPTQVSNANFSVLDAHENADYSALIGVDFLLQADMELSLADRQVKFFHADGCKDKDLAYWDSNALDIPMEAFWMRDQRQVFEVELNGQKLRATIDTGAAVSTVSLAAAERAGVTPESAGVVPACASCGAGANMKHAYFAPFNSFSIGGETIKNPHIHMASRFGRNGPDMVLGRDFLKTHHVLMAVSQGRLYFSYLGGQVFLNPTESAATAPANESQAEQGQP